MYRWLTRLAVFRATVSLALAAGFLATPLGIAHLEATAPDACEVIVFGDGGSRPILSGTSAPAERHEHCFTCHWLQSLRSVALQSRLPLTVSQGVGLVAPAATAVAESLPAASFPARAPPA